MWDTLIFISFCLAEIMFLGFSTSLNRIESKTTVSIANLHGYYHVYARNSIDVQITKTYICLVHKLMFQSLSSIDAYDKVSCR